MNERTVRGIAVAALGAFGLAGVVGTIMLMPDVPRQDGQRLPEPRTVASTSSTFTGGTHGDGYSREQFGRPWVDVDGNGCDTRNDVLQRDLVDEVVAADGCTVLTGTLVDPYSGEVVQFVRQPGYQRVQIDHVVSLHEAWHGGAAYWSPEQRLQFANDPSNLLATTLNATKGDRGPAALLAATRSEPDKWDPSPEGFCRYGRAYPVTAAEWRLDTGQDDAAALSAILRECP